LFDIVCGEAVTTKLFIKHNAYEASHIVGYLEGVWEGWRLLHYYFVNKKLNVKKKLKFKFKKGK